MKKSAKFHFDEYISLKIALIYTCFSALWILSSDQILFFFVKDPEIMTKIQMIKGWVFILTTALIIFFLLRKEIRKHLKTEAALKKSEEKHRKLISYISDVIVILDSEGIITYKSPNITEQFGWSPDELIGKHGLFTVHIDDKERIGNELTRLLKKETAKVRVVYNYLCKDGSFKPVELTAVNRVSDPVINGVLASYKDITERKHSEEQLKQSEEKYRTMIERSNDMIWAIDASGNITFFNKQAEEVTGVNLKEWIGKPFGPLIVEEDLPMVMDIFEKGLKGQPSHYELRLRKQGNELLTISVNTAPLLKDGTVSGLVSFGRNITEQKLAEKEKANLEAQLRQSQKMESVGTLAGGIAHDFNNILFPILGNTELLLEDVPEDSPLRNSLNAIYNGTMRAKDLVKQILTFSRQDSHEVKLIRIQPIIKEALKLIRSTIPTSIEIKQDINKDCGVIKADPTQIHQVVMNLATNAYHAMEDTGGKLSVNLEVIELSEDDMLVFDMGPGPYACLTVADTGIGIGQDIKEKIFEPYFTTKEQGKGTGMGLSVIHGIVKNAGGSIRVYSEPGKGTEFHVYLPILKSSFEQQEAQAKETIPGGTERILLVDDEATIVSMEKQMMERLGYSVVSRTSSVEALEAFRANPDGFDMVITDMAMPNMPGDKLASELIKIRPNIPILLCTGFSEKMHEEKAKALGINGFLMKPIIKKDLANMIREVLDNKERSDRTDSPNL